jgi:hypothetical protein
LRFASVAEHLGNYAARWSDMFIVPMKLPLLGKFHQTISLDSFIESFGRILACAARYDSTVRHRFYLAITISALSFIRDWRVTLLSKGAEFK